MIHEKKGEDKGLRCEDRAYIVLISCLLKWWHVTVLVKQRRWNRRKERRALPSPSLGWIRELPVEIVGNTPCKVRYLGGMWKGNKAARKCWFDSWNHLLWKELSFSRLQCLNTGCGFLKPVRRPSWGSWWGKWWSRAGQALGQGFSQRAHQSWVDTSVCGKS